MRQKRLIFTLLFLLAALIAVSAWLVMRWRESYAQNLIAQIWPAGPAPTVRTTMSSADSTNTLLLLGDSRVAEWGLPTLNGWNVINAGVGGMTTAQLAGHCRETIARSRPTVVLIQVGVNDLKLLGPRPDLFEPVVSTCVSNVHAVVRESRSAGARVIVTLVWPAGKITLARHLVWNSAVDNGIVEANNRLMTTLAGQPDVIVTNLLGTISERLPANERSRLYRDTLHLLPETYIQLSMALGEVLSARTQAGLPTK